MVVIKLEDFPLLELINPRIVESSGEDIAVEGCLSIPGVHGEVKRSAEVEVQFQDRMGRKKTMRASVSWPGLFNMSWTISRGCCL